MQWQILKSTGLLPSRWKENTKTKVCVGNVTAEMLRMDDGAFKSLCTKTNCFQSKGLFVLTLPDLSYHGVNSH